MPRQPIVLHGQTGVGKTLLLNLLPNALDLEGLAQHRSSLFGAVNLTPRTQQQFDSLLLARLEALNPDQPVWIEGESRKVGDIILPDSLRKNMLQAVCVLITAPLEVRIQRIIEEYSGVDPETMAQLEAPLLSLKPFFGTRRTQQLVDALHKGDLEFLVKILLVEYYDPRYLHAMRNNAYASEISSENLDEAVAALNQFAKHLPLHQQHPPLAV